MATICDGFTTLNTFLTSSGLPLLESLYSQTSRIKCPFFRRRASDTIDCLHSVGNFLIARHKSIDPSFFLPPGCKSFGESKLEQLSIEDIASIIESDWKGKQSSSLGKGYYITGKLTKEIYRDDCFFDGPDPDMPVRGLRKYLSASAQLFDHRMSRADLISLKVDQASKSIIVAWRLEGYFFFTYPNPDPAIVLTLRRILGVLNLPWHPTLKPWTGSTTYFVDENGLIKEHVENWDITVLGTLLTTPPSVSIISKELYSACDIIYNVFRSSS